MGSKGEAAMSSEQPECLICKEGTCQAVFRKCPRNERQKPEWYREIWAFDPNGLREVPNRLLGARVLENGDCI